MTFYPRIIYTQFSSNLHLTPKNLATQFYKSQKIGQKDNSKARCLIAISSSGWNSIINLEGEIGSARGRSLKQHTDRQTECVGGPWAHLQCTLACISTAENLRRWKSCIRPYIIHRWIRSRLNERMRTRRSVRTITVWGSVLKGSGLRGVWRALSSSEGSPKSTQRETRP